MMCIILLFIDTSTTEIYTLSLHDALPIWVLPIGGLKEKLTAAARAGVKTVVVPARPRSRSEEHTSELQSPCNLVCRLLLEKKKKNNLRADFLSEFCSEKFI